MKISTNYTKHKYAAQTSDQVVEDVIGSQLRSFYSTIETQKVPSQFLKLLEKLDAKMPATRE